jgi:hypothetical protein
LDAAKFELPIIGFLAAATTVSFFNGMLVADGFTSYGILAFLLLAFPRERSGIETAILASILAFSLTTHLTHFWIIASMLVVLIITRKLFGLNVHRHAVKIGAACLMIGILSIQVTNLATKLVVGKEPQLLPLLSARFIADGPGLAFIKSGCDNQRFEICKLTFRNPESNPAILFSNIPGDGYLSGTPAQRQRMGEQDVAFAFAVFQRYPLWQTGKIVSNTWSQLTFGKYTGLNVGCWDRDPDCWLSVPEPVRSELRSSLAGRNAWPEEQINVVFNIIIVASLLSIVIFWSQRDRLSPQQRNDLSLVLSMGSCAFLVAAFFGGAVADPQWRYIGRIVWLVPLVAAVLASCRFFKREAITKTHQSTAGSEIKQQTSATTAL